ncbi:MAG: oligopeptide transport system substrate-binding protein [Acidobacteriota bacterium]|jgi:oligopeptide transport system substrate-binding protein|nr:oligopeptide transport system substrate-binding protein [Acidobacteriota bacterium]
MKVVGKKISGLRRVMYARSARLWVSLVLSATLLLGSCFREEKGERFYGKAVVPATQEFRWSDGGLPKVFDPARAAAPPDTDAVRALYEGLTDYEPGTLRPSPAVASRWEPAEGGRRWTFHLRDGARWTNGDPVTAQDFVRSWQRTLRLGERAPHASLLSNIEGAESLTTQMVENEQGGMTTGESERAHEDEKPARGSSAKPAPRPKAFGVVALDTKTLRVTLRRPDMSFPALVAHPVFRPVHELSPEAVLPEWEEQRPGGGAQTEPGIVTNGAFSLSRLAGDSVELSRAESYWDAASVTLERVRFVAGGDTESALAAYRAGEVDVVSNAAVEPLAVKLLTPYEDFHRETFAALNYYRFNTARPPFDDVRVRQALAFALDVERLSKDTLGGATEPTRTFIPVPLEEAGEGTDVTRDTDADNDGASGLEHNVERARRLLEQAGYPGGVHFPRVRLLVNRNEQQRLVAQAVARMWREALGVETEIVVRPWEEYETMLRSGDYDVARRSLVMQTTDEETNMRQLFGEGGEAQAVTPELETAPAATPAGSPTGAEAVADAALAHARPTPAALTEAQALRELPAIPLHFASSYALVKPYVDGFESNLLDAPSLKHVRINRDWRPPAAEQSARLSRAAKP